MGVMVVTGGAGFVGSNLVRALGLRSADVVVVDDERSRVAKEANLAGCRIADFIDKRRFLDLVARGRYGTAVEAVLHQGAITDTMELNEQVMMEANLAASRTLLAWAVPKRIPFVYASSAAVYGASTTFAEAEPNERPLNVYGRSKLLVDQLVRSAQREARAALVGLRYFNVYGPGESHKGRMASVVYQLFHQLVATGAVRLFKGTGGYGDGEQRRDFIHVDDVVKVNLYFLESSARSGVVNCGTGRSRSFNDVARALITAHGSGRIEYVPLPEGLEARYQSFTEADTAGLRRLGYSDPFMDVEEGVRRYHALLAPRPSAP